MSHASTPSHSHAAHGHDEPHEHVIVSQFMLRAVLGLLLFFTLLTVGSAWAEQWVAVTFNIEIPQWVNVAVALSIATVKTILVVAIFMQLRYDNPINTLIFVFTIMTVACFIGFTALDLGKRGTIDPRKAQYVIPGGGGGAGLPNQSVPMTEFARQRAIERGEYDPEHAHAHASHGAGLSGTDAGFYRVRPTLGSSTDISRPVEGVTIPGLPGYVAPAMHGHGDTHAHEEHSPASTRTGGENPTPKAAHGEPAPTAPVAPGRH